MKAIEALQHRMARLGHPIFLVAVALLLLNDHYLKGRAAGWLTGKLSDFAGLYALYYFVVTVSGWRPKPVRLSLALCWIIWKLPISDPLILFWNQLGVLPVGRVADVTDLAALVVLLFPVSFDYSGPAIRGIFVYVICFISLLSFLGTTVAETRFSRIMLDSYEESKNKVEITLKSNKINYFHANSLELKDKINTAYHQSGDNYVNLIKKIAHLEIKGRASRYYFETNEKGIFLELLLVKTDTGFTENYSCDYSSKGTAILGVMNVLDTVADANFFMQLIKDTKPKIQSPRPGLWNAPLGLAKSREIRDLLSPLFEDYNQNTSCRYHYWEQMADSLRQ